MSLTPYLTVTDCVAAIRFYERAFSAQETGPRLVSPENTVLHTEMTIDDARFMLADENAAADNHSPLALGGTPIRLNLETENIDALAEQATDAGATILIPIADQFYGYRSGRLQDPFGHLWILSQKIEDLEPGEMQRRLTEIMSGKG